MIDRFLSCVVAVGLALLVWLYARSREQEVMDNVTLPVTVVLAPRQAEHYTLELEGPAQVTVSFSGAPQRIRELHGMLQRKEVHIVKTIAVPNERLGEGRYSDAAVVEAGDVQAPLGVTVIPVEGRNRLPFTLHRMVERRLPVRFDHLREEAAGPVVLDPATVLVRGPREVLDRAQAIPTEPSELPSRPMHSPISVAAIGRVPLVKELEGRPVRVTPPTVLVRVPGKPRKFYEVADVPVRFLCPANFHLRPKFIDERSAKVTLKLLGPPQDEPPRVVAFIDLTHGKFLSGLTHEPLRLHLPRDFQLAHDAPRVVTFELMPADAQLDGLGLPFPVVPAVSPHLDSKSKRD
jgi:hypothetical protein